MTRSRVEFVAVRPGIIDDENMDASYRNAVDFDILRAVAVKKVKGMI